MSIQIDSIINDDCMNVMTQMEDQSIDMVLTSPFYNTNTKAGKTRTLKNTTVGRGQYDYVRYDKFVDNMTSEEYKNFTVNLFRNFERILSDRGVVVYNISYGANGADDLVNTLYAVINETGFRIADVIVRKKETAFPNSCSPTKLTRIWEFVFVLCKEKSFFSFHTNKREKSKRKTGQKAYENIYNFIEAPNNDGSCQFNKATYSTELCMKLLQIYAPPKGVVYDPFMGSGTTAVACKKMGLHFIGTEISENQCEYAKKRLVEVEYGDSSQEQYRMEGF